MRNVEREKLTRIHVRDPERVCGRVDARVVEAHRWAAQRDARNLAERNRAFRAHGRRRAPDGRGDGSEGDRRLHTATLSAD